MNTQKMISKCMEAIHAQRFVEAEKLARKIISQQPNQVQACQFLALALYSQGKYQAAQAWFDKTVKLSHQHPSALVSRAANALAQGNWLQVIADTDIVLQHNPRHFGAWMNRGLAFAEQTQWEAGLSAFNEALAIEPANTKAALEAQIARGHLGKLEAGSLLPVTTQDVENYFPQWLILLELTMSNLPAQAATLLQQLHEKITNDTSKILRLAQKAKSIGLTDQASVIADDLCPSAPEIHKEALLLLASIHLGRGLPEQACEYYQRLLEVAPDYWQAHSNYLIAIQYNPTCSQTQINAEHYHWAQKHTQSKPYKQHQRISKSTDIRIAWIGPRLASGPTETFFAPVLEQMPRTGAQHYLYKTHAHQDKATQRFIEAADHYIDASSMDSKTLIKQVHKDKIDIAIELSGHGPHHSLRAFSQRLAPIQLSWLDYFNPTGIDNIDYFISDSILSGAQAPNNHLLLPHGRLHYNPPSFVTKIKSNTTDIINYGCFNRIAKINHQVLSVWSEILHHTPGATLTLISWHFDSKQNREHFLKRAQNANISANRLILRGNQSYQDLLDTYNDIDVALDPFPFSGCASSCDALWMGTPVITLSGDTMVSRQTHSVLHHCDLNEWVAYSHDQYITIAINTAHDIQQSPDRKLHIHQQFSEKFCNIKRFARNFESQLVKLL